MSKGSARRPSAVDAATVARNWMQTFGRRRRGREGETMPESQSQVRWAHSVLAGKAKGDRTVAAEIVAAMEGKDMSDLPERAGGKQPLRHLGKIARKR